MRLEVDGCSGGGSGELWLGGLWGSMSEISLTTFARLLAMWSMLFEMPWSCKAGTLAGFSEVPSSLPLSLPPTVWVCVAFIAVWNFWLFSTQLSFLLICSVFF